MDRLQPLLNALPIDRYIPDLLALLKNNASLVLAAEPGAGKTTRLPAALLGQIKGQIFVLEPRRMAAIAAAQRIADETNSKLGATIGYQVRFDNCTTSDTQLVFMTEALLTRRMLTDPELTGVGAIVLDEFHERSLNVDLALAMSKELQLLGHPLKIIVMSATLDTEKVSAYLGHCPVVNVPGQIFPLKIHYLSQKMRGRTDHDFFKEFTLAVKQAFEQNSGDILAFLPGRGEIEKAHMNLSAWAKQNNIDLLNLHAAIPMEHQRHILAQTKIRRIILSTNVAESSVTVNGVTAVVDSGLVKVLRQDPRTGFSRLELSKVSQASSTQRAGRAARQSPGQCYRLWSQTEQRSLPAFELPEILRIDLSECLLFLSAQGISDFTQFSWFQIPSPAQLKRAAKDLADLGAMDEQNKITPLGKAMLHWPLPPRLSKLMVIAEQKKQVALAADLVGLLLERDLLQRDASEKYIGDAWECDLSLRWSLLKSWRQGHRDQDVVASAARMVDTVARSLTRHKNANGEIEDIPHLLLAAFPDRLCRRRGQTDRAMMNGGRGVRLSPNSIVKSSNFFLALDGVDLEGSADTLVSLACGVSLSALKNTFKNEIKTRERTYFNDEDQRFLTVKESVWHDFVLEESQPRAAAAESIQDGLVEALFHRLDWLKMQNPGLRQWFERWDFFVRHTTPSTPMTDTQIKQAWTSAAFGATSFKEVIERDLIYHFESQLSPGCRQDFHRQVPEKIQVPSGSSIEIHYPADQPPFLQVRLQELFGWASTPAVMDGKIPLVIHLLAPNFRPVQTTADLASFWRKGYFEVRKELKIRYPKHSWPEDPLTARPEAKGRRRN